MRRTHGRGPLNLGKLGSLREASGVPPPYIGPPLGFQGPRTPSLRALAGQAMPLIWLCP